MATLSELYASLCCDLSPLWERRASGVPWEEHYDVLVIHPLNRSGGADCTSLPPAAAAFAAALLRFCEREMRLRGALWDPPAEALAERAVCRGSAAAISEDGSIDGFSCGSYELHCVEAVRPPPRVQERYAAALSDTYYCDGADATRPQWIVMPAESAAAAENDVECESARRKRRAFLEAAAQAHHDESEGAPTDGVAAAHVFVGLHCTAAANVAAICSGGFDRDKCGAANGSWYGEGIYHTTQLEYALRYRAAHDATVPVVVSFVASHRVRYMDDVRCGPVAEGFDGQYTVSTYNAGRFGGPFPCGDGQVPDGDDYCAKDERGCLPVAVLYFKRAVGRTRPMPPRSTVVVH